MTIPFTDDAWMAAALALGRRNLGGAAPNPCVGALVVRDGAVVGRGVTGIGGRPHGERLALEAAGQAAREATLFVTLEPCSHHGATPPCVDAVVKSGIARVVSALEDPDPRVAGRGHAALRDAGVAVTVGVGAIYARWDHLGHILRVTQGRPMVTLKMAQTPDGYAGGGAHDARLLITGAVADAYTHIQRSLHDAIMIGAGTARDDDPLMTVRLPGMETQKRLRIILDSRLTLSPRSRLAATARETPTLLIAGQGVPSDAAAAFQDATGVEVVRVAMDLLGRVALPAALGLLAQRGVTRIFCEGGPRLAESLITNGFADQIILHTGVKPFGGAGRVALRTAARALLGDPALYRIAGEEQLGADHMIRYERLS
jgi:diaminohydroxyphosphoribosylaminopyrimidine deaminase/5-amino-6-(5-phosphoribosylamino)uracil reductase